MTSGPRRRRRAAVLLALAVACGGLAASSVGRRERAVEERVGAPLPVLVARAEIDAGTELTAKRAARVLAVRAVPGRFVPADAFADPGEVEGFTTSTALPAGSYVTAAHVARASDADGGGRREGGIGRGERAVEVAVAGGDPPPPGARVDVLVTSERDAGGGRTFVALQSVELLDARPAEAVAGGGGGQDERPAAGTLATLRVTPRQAVFLTAAQNFAREVRLLVRAPGDRRRIPRSAQTASVP